MACKSEARNGFAAIKVVILSAKSSLWRCKDKHLSRYLQIFPQLSLLVPKHFVLSPSYSPDMVSVEEQHTFRADTNKWKSVTPPMLCRLVIWNYHRRLLTKDNAENDATGMLKMYPRCVREGSQCLQRTLVGCFSNTFVGITLFVSKQGLW